jgi:hypothetical protein
MVGNISPSFDVKKGNVRLRKAFQGDEDVFPRTGFSYGQGGEMLKDKQDIPNIFANVQGMKRLLEIPNFRVRPAAQIGHQAGVLKYHDD